MFNNYFIAEKPSYYQLYLTLITLFLFYTISCSEDIVITPEPELTSKGKLVVNSNPQGAQLFNDDVFTNKITPDSIELNVGNHSAKLIMHNYFPSGSSFTIRTDSITRLDVNLMPWSVYINISITCQTVDSTIYFTYRLNSNNFNLYYVVDSISITRPTTDYGNYVVYTEQKYGGAPLIEGDNYRVPQSDSNNFHYVKGTYTFLFIGKCGNYPVEIEAVDYVN